MKLEIMGYITYGSIAIALVISIVVMIGIFRLKGSGKAWIYEDRLLLGVCLMTLIMDTFRLAVIWILPTSLYGSPWVAVLLFPDIVYALFALPWLMFLDYMANKSRIRVRRFAYYSAVPVLIMIMSIAVVVYTQLTPALFEDYYYPAWMVFDMIRISIVSAYMVIGYRTISDFQRRRMEPMFIRLDFFIIPWIIGLVCVHGFKRVTVSFFASISLLITYLAYKQRCKYVYRDTDIFKEEFAPYFANYVEKLRLKGECAFLISAEGERDAITEVLEQCRPEKSFLLQKNDGTYMLYTLEKGKAVVGLFEQTLRDAGEAHVPPVSLSVSHHIKDKTESSGDFIRRIITGSHGDGSFDIRKGDKDEYSRNPFRKT